MKTLADFEAVVIELKTERDHLRALLRNVEWKGSSVPGGPCCPVCRGPGDDRKRHEPGCPLAAALSEDTQVKIKQGVGNETHYQCGRN